MARGRRWSLFLTFNDINLRNGKRKGVRERQNVERKVSINQWNLLRRRADGCWEKKIKGGNKKKGPPLRFQLLADEALKIKSVR